MPGMPLIGIMDRGGGGGDKHTMHHSGSLTSKEMSKRSREEMEQDMADKQKRLNDAINRSTSSSNRREKLAPLQAAVSKVICNQYFDLCLGVVILVNLLLVVIETNIRARDDEVPALLSLISKGLLAFYTVEVCLRLFVDRLNFFNSYCNILDLGIVSADLLVELLSTWIGSLPSLTVLRVLRMFRALRVIRAIRVLSLFRELYIMMHGFVSAMKAIFWATVLLSIMLVILSIVAVEAIHPQNLEVAETGLYDGCDRCARAFESIEASVITLVQNVVAGDSWGQVTIPLMEHAPWTSLFFFTVLVTVQLGMMNLILSVIVDKATQAQAEDEAFQLAQKNARYTEAKRTLLSFMRDLDADKDGQLSLEEIYSGFDTHDDFQMQMLSLDVQREDLETVFKLMDETRCGAVQYTEFVEELHQLKNQNTEKTMLYMRSALSDIGGFLEEKVSHLVDMLDKHSEEVFEKMQAQEDRVNNLMDTLEKKMLATIEIDDNVTAENELQAADALEGKLGREEQKRCLNASSNGSVGEASSSNQKAGKQFSAGGMQERGPADHLLSPELQALRRDVEAMNMSLARTLAQAREDQKRLLSQPVALFGAGIRSGPGVGRPPAVGSDNNNKATALEVPSSDYVLMRPSAAQRGYEPRRGIMMPSCCSIAPGSKSEDNMINLANLQQRPALS